MRLNSVRLQICGPEIIRFLNMAVYHQISFQNVVRSEESISATVDLRDVREVLKLKKKADISIRVLHKRGPYFLWKKCRRRKLAAVFAVLSFSALYVLSLFVWDISFEGNIRYTDSFLMHYVREEGIRPGILIRGISCESIEKKLRSSFEDITWVNAHVEGTRLIIEVEENNTVGLRWEEAVPCDLIAEKSGTVGRIVTRSGVPQVSEGDHVEKGDILISGRIPIRDDSDTIIRSRQTEASGEVWIRYESVYENTISRLQVKRHYQKEKKSFGLILFGHRFCLPGSLIPDQAELSVEQTQWKLFDCLYLPVYSEVYHNRFYEEAYISYDDKSLEKMADAAFYDFLLDLDKLGVEIIEKNVTIETGAADCCLRASLILEENAVKRVPLEEPAAPEESSG